MDVIETSADIDLDEHFRAFRRVFKSSRNYKIAMSSALGITAIYLVFALLVGFTTEWFFIIGALLIGWAVLPFVQRRGLRAAREASPSATSTQNYRISAEGLHLSGSLFEIGLKWDAITKVRETDEFIFFFFGKDAAYFLPKRVLTESQLGAVRRVVSGTIGSRAALAV